MSPMIALADLKNLTEDEVKKHLAVNYQTEEFDKNYDNYGKPDPEIEKKLVGLKVLLAYESVGDYGCDSSSFFVLKDEKSGTLYELHGSHCSCYGFEGQFNLEGTIPDALRLRFNEGGIYWAGGYDDNEDEHKKIISEFLTNLK